MKSIIKNLIGYFLSSVNLQIISKAHHDKLLKANTYMLVFKYLSILNKTIDFSNVKHAIENSTSQSAQDIILLILLNFKCDGYFVEFGAADGFYLSNTYLLEKEYAWSGIVCEPCISYHERLKHHRRCHIDYSCIDAASGKLIDFCETNNPILSTIKGYEDSDAHSTLRRWKNKYKVKTTSLSDLLSKYDSPKLIDFLSIDTEGSEFAILQEFPFIDYIIKIILVEHNFTASRGKIYDLLSNQGYTRILIEHSYVDDWYIHNSILAEVCNIA